jgi:hypothetical protein
VKGINIDFEQNLQNDKLNISSYDVFLQLDYQKEIDGWDSYSFTDKINFICKDVRDVISEYVVLPDGQIRQKPKAVLISPVSILKFNYIMDSLNLFELAARVDYE